MRVVGEGNNHEMEAKIRELLTVSHPEVAKIELDPDESTFTPECGVATQETYVGALYGRSAVEDIGERHVGEIAEFQPPHSPPDSGVMLVGRRRVEHDGVTSDNHGPLPRCATTRAHSTLFSASLIHSKFELTCSKTAILCLKIVLVPMCSLTPRAHMSR